MDPKQRVIEGIRRAVEEQAPDGLDAVLQAIEQRQASLPHKRRKRRWIPAAAGVAAAAAVVCLLAYPAAFRPVREPSVSGEPPVHEAGIPLEATGVVLKAYGPPSPGAASEARMLEPDLAVNINGDPFGWDNGISAVLLGGGKSRYTVRLPFELECEGENILTVEYRTSQGQFESRLVADDAEELQELQNRVQTINYYNDKAWGYTSLGENIQLTYAEQKTAQGQLGIRLTMDRESTATAFDLETAFRRQIEDTAVRITLTFADGTRSTSEIRFSFSGKVTGALEATLVSQPES